MYASICVHRCIYIYICISTYMRTCMRICARSPLPRPPCEVSLANSALRGLPCQVYHILFCFVCLSSFIILNNDSCFHGFMVFMVSRFVGVGDQQRSGMLEMYHRTCNLPNHETVICRSPLRRFSSEVSPARSLARYPLRAPLARFPLRGPPCGAYLGAYRKLKIWRDGYMRA